MKKVNWENHLPPNLQVGNFHDYHCYCCLLDTLGSINVLPKIQLPRIGCHVLDIAWPTRNRKQLLPLLILILCLWCCSLELHLLKKNLNIIFNSYSTCKLLKYPEPLFMYCYPLWFSPLLPSDFSFTYAFVPLEMQLVFCPLYELVKVLLNLDIILCCLPCYFGVICKFDNCVF